MKKRPLRYGMVGGGVGSFIGGVHRKAIAIDEMAELTAGCFSDHDERNKETGNRYGLDEERIYPDYRTMAERENAREDGIDFVSITTPNDTHYEIAKCFLEHGIHVACEKPLCFTAEQARDLQETADRKGLLFCVTYTYMGYNMIKLAREMITKGEIGQLINVNCEYLQEWQIDTVGMSSDEVSRNGVWRSDPKRSGISNCVGDIGTHIESVVSYITGSRVTKVAAVLDSYKQKLDLNANILVELADGCHGVFCPSQVCVGHANGLRVRIFGTEGAVEWFQEEPDHLLVVKKGRPKQIYDRGCGYIPGRAERISRLPAGHPEGLIVAFSNIYRSFMGAIIKKNNGELLTGDDMDYPDITYGIHGVEFDTAVINSSRNGSAWTDVSCYGWY